VESLLSAIATTEDERVRYREEVRHPALPAPEIATGTMWITADGTMMRDQITPKREISEIGETTARLRTSPEADPTLFPIPDRLRGTLQAMRLVLTGEALPEGVETGLSADEGGWRLTLDLGSGPTATLFGCGKRARGIETENETGIRRTVRFLGAE
jgi:hypothetical protein